MLKNVCCIDDGEGGGFRIESEAGLHKVVATIEEAMQCIENHLNHGDCALFQSEASRYLGLTMQYLEPTCLDLGSGGWPVCDWAIQVELPDAEFLDYSCGRTPARAIQMRADIGNLPFRVDRIGSIHASHLIEDWPRTEWSGLFAEWKRVLRPGGHLVVLVPEAERFQRAVAAGQSPNLAHSKPEPSVGDISEAGKSVGFEVIEDRLCDLFPGDYSIIGVLRKP